jgi:hypothetical protein
MDTMRAIYVIDTIEESFDVNSVYYKDLRVWPLIRMEIIKCFEHPDRKISAAKQKEIDENYCCRIIPDPQQFAELGHYRGVDYLFFSLHGHHRVRIEGKYYNPFTDPYIEALKDKHSFLKMELSTSHVKTTSPRCIPTIFLKRTEDRVDYSPDTDDITNFEKLRKFLLSICEIDLDRKVIIHEANQIEQYRLYFLDLLMQARPKAALLVCYYYDVGMGLIWACRDLNITSVDLQHGYRVNTLQDERWSKIPPDGYKLLPDFFYVWSEAFKRSLERRRPASCRCHKAIVGNNAWMQKLIQEELLVDGINKDFLEYLKQKEKVVLVSLQLPGPLPRHLIEAIKRLPKDWLWLMRCHPHYGKGEIDNVTKELCSSGIDNYEVEISTKHPLLELLKHTHHHLTGYSSVCLDAGL